jgi:hypothetical protein
MASGIYPAIRSNSLRSISAKVVQRDLSPLQVAEPVGAQALQALGLGVEGVADEIEVHAVLDRLRLRHLVERDAWPAGVAVAGEQDHVLRSGVFGNLPPEDIGPEPGHSRGRRRSQSRLRPANCSYRYSLHERTPAIRASGGPGAEAAGAHVPEGMAAGTLRPSRRGRRGQMAVRPQSAAMTAPVM